jgi:uncharacterized protein
MKTAPPRADTANPSPFRRASAAAALALTLCAPAALAQDQAARSTAAAPADAAVGNRALPVFWARRLTGYLTTRDGVRLRYSVLLPKGKGPFPLIVNYSGYDPGSIGGAAYLAGDTTMSAGIDRTLVEHGYAVAGVNARGTACSEGLFANSDHTYGQDGHDAIEFLAAQPWSNGNVGMANWSWAGMSQLVTAEQRPPHLKAIAPGMVLGDPRLDNSAPGGVTEPGMQTAWWEEYVPWRWAAALASAKAEGDARCVDQIATNLRTSQANAVTTSALAHPLRDAAVEERHFAASAAAIAVPVLSFKAYQDEAVSSREDHYQDRLQPGQVWMIQSNGPHDLYESLEFRKTLVAFFDRFVKGEANGFEAQPHLRIWLETATAPSPRGVFEGMHPRTVISRQDLPVATHTRTFALSGAGNMVEQGQGSGAADAYDYPMPGPVVNTEYGANGWGPLPRDWRHGSVAYTSAPIAQGFVTYDSSSADLWVSSSEATDADLQVTLTEVRPDGAEVFVQRGWLRLSDRKLDPQRSTPTRPVLVDTPEAIAAIHLDQPVLARVELNPFAHAFRAGSKIRLWVDTPSQTGEYRFAYTSAPTRNAIWHDADHPSRLVLSVLDDAAPATPQPACGQSVMEPCRRDPLATAP